MQNNISLTLENIFYDERNRWYYEKENEILYVSSITITTPRMVTYDNTNNMKIKHYIKMGEECPICYEQILYKKHAYLTDCGHSFHYECMNNYIYKNFRTISNSADYNCPCPICRQDVGDGVGLYSNDIKCLYCNNYNSLDNLENFWDNITSIIPKQCYNSNYNAHDLGMINTCVECINYRKSGKRWV